MEYMLDAGDRIQFQSGNHTRRRKMEQKALHWDVYKTGAGKQGYASYQLRKL